MTRHEESKYLPYRPEDMYALVSDIESYPQFLPWCSAARIRSRKETENGAVLDADLVVSFAAFREKFGSRVTLDEVNRRINVDYLDGPFKVLKNYWEFEPEGEGTRVHFFVEFEFKSRILQMAIGQVFDMAMRRIVGAFEARAEVLYS